MQLLKNNRIFLSQPGVAIAPGVMTNEEVLQKVKYNFRGSDDEYRKIERGINYIFNLCGTQVRVGKSPDKSLIEYVIEASKNCLLQSNITADNVDLLIYGGMFREYFEPATAMEIACKLGIKKLQAFDVTSACVGLIQSVVTAVALMCVDTSINVSLCCSSEVVKDYDDYIDFDIQSFKDLETKGAGLTIGSAASAWLLTREVNGNGAARIRNFNNISLPHSHDLCKFIVGEKFSSNNRKLLEIGRNHLPIELSKFINISGWDIKQLDHLICHQPSVRMIRGLCNKIGLDEDKAALTHQLYGNTVNSTIPLTFDHLLKNDKIHNNDKIIISGFGAGFTMVNIAMVWNDN